MKLQVKELRRLKENRNKASSAGRAAKIVKFALETECLNEELDNKPIQVQMEMQHTTLKDSLTHYLAFLSLLFVRKPVEYSTVDMNGCCYTLRSQMD